MRKLCLALQYAPVPPRRPKLGQHFLQDARCRRRIVEALALRSNDLVIEIGPGHGAMTELLAQRARQVVAVEIDPAFVQELRQRFGAGSRVEILHADILSVDLAALCRQHGAPQGVVFGNLPYYITSPIIRYLFTFASQIRAMGLLVQREVAERLAAQPNSRDYGYLTVLAQVYSQPRLVLKVPPGAFSPPPKVLSALVDFQMSPRFPHWQPEVRERFLEFVKRCFAQKRKNLPNNLAEVYGREQVEQGLVGLGIPSNMRAEQLTLEQLAELFGRLA